MSNSNFTNTDLSETNLSIALMTGANLVNVSANGTNLDGCALSNATLTGIKSGQVTGTPKSLPSGWILQNGYLVGPGANALWKSNCLSCMRTIQPKYQNVRNGHNPCAYCAGNKIDPTEALNIAKSRKLKRLEPFPGNLIPWNAQYLSVKRKLQLPTRS